MNEHEKRLREWFRMVSVAPSTAEKADSLLTSALAQARADALEEAARLIDEAHGLAERRADEMRDTRATTDRELGEIAFAAGVLETQAQRIRALAGTTPPASIPVERVREVLEHARDALCHTEGERSVLLTLGRNLGVPLDGAGERRREPSSRAHWCDEERGCSDACPACRENVARGFNPDGTDKASP